MARACMIALGSNLGDRLASLQLGIEGLGQGRIEWCAASGLWESEPLGGCQDLPYLNAVIECRGARDPWDLLALCKRIERDVGRPADAPRNAPRCLDLDLLAVEGILLRSPALSLPHPRMQGRAFVWRPLAELEGLHRFFPDGHLEEGRGALERVAGPEGIQMHNQQEMSARSPQGRIVDRPRGES